VPIEVRALSPGKPEVGKDEPRVFLESESVGEQSPAGRNTQEPEEESFSQVPGPSGFLVEGGAGGQPAVIGLAENPYPRINAITRIPEGWGGT
jgi:hypothetical protein